MMLFHFLSGHEQMERILLTDNNFLSFEFLKSLSSRAEDGNGEVIVGVRRLNSFVSPTQSYTLSPPSLHHPNFSPSVAPKQHQHQKQRHAVQRQPSNGSTSGGSGHQPHHRHRRTESQDSCGCVLPVAITTVTSAVGMRRNNSPIALTVVNEVMISRLTRHENQNPFYLPLSSSFGLFLCC